MTIHRKQEEGRLLQCPFAVENDKLGGRLMRRNQCVSVGPLLYTSTLTPIIWLQERSSSPPSIAADPLYPPVDDEPDREPFFF
jgi:hypothetical protein